MAKKQLQTTKLSNHQETRLTPLLIAPTQVLRGEKCLSNSIKAIAHLGKFPLVVVGNQTLEIIQPNLQPMLSQYGLKAAYASYSPDCAESSLIILKEKVAAHQADIIIGI